MENKVNQRVIEFINYKKVSKLQFCEMNNISYTTFSNTISIGRNFNLGIIIEILSRNSELNSDWLLLGKGKMLQESVIIPEKNESDLTKYMLQRIEDLIRENTELKYQLKEKK